MYEEFLKWSVSEKLAFWGVVVTFLVGVLPHIVNLFRIRKKILEIDLRAIQIETYSLRDNEIIPVYHHENQIERYISGRVLNLTKRQIRSLDLKIQVSVNTDSWYLQDADDGKVQDDGTWMSRIYIGIDAIGTDHIIEIILRDKFGRKGTPLKLMVRPER